MPRRIARRGARATERGKPVSPPTTTVHIDPKTGRPIARWGEHAPPRRGPGPLGPNVPRVTAPPGKPLPPGAVGVPSPPHLPKPTMTDKPWGPTRRPPTRKFRPPVKAQPGKVPPRGKAPPVRTLTLKEKVDLANRIRGLPLAEKVRISNEAMRQPPPRKRFR